MILYKKTSESNPGRDYLQLKVQGNEICADLCVVVRYRLAASG